MDTVIDISGKVLTSCKKKKLSLVLFSKNLLPDLRKIKTDLVKNVLIVDKSKNEQNFLENEYFMSAKNFDEEFMEKIRGCFIVMENPDLTESEYITKMEIFNKFFPLVAVFNNDSEKIYLNSEMPGWGEKIFVDKKLTIYINLSVKEFKKFTVDFKSLFKSKNLGSLSSKVDFPEAETTTASEIFQSSSEIVKPVSVKRKKGLNWEMFDGIVRPSMRPDHSSPLWIKEFYTYLRDITSRFIPPGKEKLLEFIVNSDTIKSVWLSVFTSKNINPNNGENYETFEAVGDGFLKFGIYVYWVEREPTIGEDHLNDLKKKYLSKTFQSLLGEKMGLHEWVMIPESQRDHMDTKEDLTEAYFGGLNQVLNKATNGNRGFSVSILLTFYRKLFEFFDLEPTAKTDQDDKTWVTQLLNQIAVVPKKDKIVELKKPPGVNRNVWKKISENLKNDLAKNGLMYNVKGEKKESGFEMDQFQNEDGSWVTEIYFNDLGGKTFTDRGIEVEKLKNKLLARSTSKTKDPSETKAWTKAREKLKSMGVDQDWVDNQKTIRNQKNIQNFDQVLEKAKSKNPNIVSVYPKTEQSSDAVIATIYGVDDKGRKNVLHQIIHDVGKKNFNSYQEVADDYLRS